MLWVSSLFGTECVEDEAGRQHGGWQHLRQGKERGHGRSQGDTIPGLLNAAQRGDDTEVDRCRRLNVLGSTPSEVDWAMKILKLIMIEAEQAKS
ncbi:hypothetical protein EJB05_49070 [Eragrostis curvula]|uniref:Uncharacterized protein n=1 Tax=Eragrostis curvula TaxID=38414 RepID=A0A5J9T3C8_9POAL|nr:hypothetical protein EJB05_49070 [Eragrostis curvula]